MKGNANAQHSHVSMRPWQMTCERDWFIWTIHCREMAHSFIEMSSHTSVMEKYVRSVAHTASFTWNLLSSTRSSVLRMTTWCTCSLLIFGCFTSSLCFVCAESEWTNGIRDMQWFAMVCEMLERIHCNVMTCSDVVILEYLAVDLWMGVYCTWAVDWGYCVSGWHRVPSYSILKCNAVSNSLSVSPPGRANLSWMHTHLHWCITKCDTSALRWLVYICMFTIESSRREQGRKSRGASDLFGNSSISLQCLTT